MALLTRGNGLMIYKMGMELRSELIIRSIKVIIMKERNKEKVNSYEVTAPSTKGTFMIITFMVKGFIYGLIGGSIMEIGLIIR